VTGKETLRQQWERGEGDDNEALILLRDMRARGEDITEHVQAAKALITSGLHYPGAFRLLFELRDLELDVFEPSEWDELGLSYLAIAEQDLANWREIDAVEDIDDIEGYAMRLGLTLDQNTLQSTRARVQERIDEAEDRAADQARDQDQEIPREHDPQTQDEEIEALFTRLADG
jgi:hypothetical protein